MSLAGTACGAGRHARRFPPASTVRLRGDGRWSGLPLTGPPTAQRTRRLLGRATNACRARARVA
eukprot:9946705-Alexandrium_andersonii.AAC.1